MLRSRLKGALETDVPMDSCTSFKVGGVADMLVYPENIEDMKETVLYAKKEGLDLFILGFGSNLLVGDRGIRGIVLNLARGFKGIRVMNDNMLDCSAGASLGLVVSKSAKHGLKGAEFLSGIPGTLGGAVRMNAGAFGSEMKDIIETVTFMNKDGEIIKRGKENLEFEYRNLHIDDGSIILSATLALETDNEEAVRKRIRHFAEERAIRQPLGRATAGSVFKNPPGDFAGRLIEEAGLKGKLVGGAMVSEKHANFIENVGGASAADILALIEIIKDMVFKNSGIMLETEVQIVGDK
ncbi:MAG: UDP-N-acetylmuramate dehydrogenase [bacterium]|nr:UDP-N-acetylmuramate dehydrogenase [bacterium]